MAVRAFYNGFGLAMLHAFGVPACPDIEIVGSLQNLEAPFVCFFPYPIFSVREHGFLIKPFVFMISVREVPTEAIFRGKNPCLSPHPCHLSSSSSTAGC